jgi:hypothetical protein
MTHGFLLVMALLEVVGLLEFDGLAEVAVNLTSGEFRQKRLRRVFHIAEGPHLPLICSRTR